MKRALAFPVALALLVAGCTPAPAPPATEAAAQPQASPPPATPAPPAAPVPFTMDPVTAWRNRLGNLPPDAADVIGRVDSCTHFSGEFNSDQSDRDRQIARVMREQRCDTIERETATLREMYGDRPDVIEALELALNGPPH